MEIKIEHMMDAGCGGRKNQDAFWVKEDTIEEKRAVLAVVCDGVGGAYHGEMASAKVIEYMKNGFFKNLSCYVEQRFTMEQIGQTIDRFLKKANQYLYEESRRKGVQTGTTASIFFLLDYEYLIANVGDSRVYWRKKEGLYRTKDHTILEKNKKIEKGMDHVLWQSVGSQKKLTIDHYEGRWEDEMDVLLVTDGAYRSFQKQEIRDYCMYGNLKKMKKEAKRRKEQDNMTGVRIQIRCERY